MNVIDKAMVRVVNGCLDAEQPISLSPTATITSEGVECAGFFGEKVGLHVATGGSMTEWLPTLLHEYCHLQQWKEDRDQFVQLDASESLVFKWIDGSIELSELELSKAINDSIYLEGDCEKRVVHLIHEWELTDYINTVHYAQKGSSYCHFYHAVKKHRKWYKPGFAPYKLEEVWRHFPTIVDPSWVPSEGHMKLFERCI